MISTAAKIVDSINRADHLNVYAQKDKLPRKNVADEFLSIIIPVLKY